jgi:UPF0271 protein
MALSAEESRSRWSASCSRLERVAGACGAKILHVKPHGSLYNQAGRYRGIACAIASGVARWRRDVALVGLAGPAGTTMLREFREAGFTALAEAFADRRYEADGTLRAGKFGDALIHDPLIAGAQAARLARGEGVVAVGGATEVQRSTRRRCAYTATRLAVEIAKAVREATG